MHLGLRADKEGRTAALRVIGGFACNEGFVFSFFPFVGYTRSLRKMRREQEEDPRR